MRGFALENERMEMTQVRGARVVGALKPLHFAANSCRVKGTRNQAFVNLLYATCSLSLVSQEMMNDAVDGVLEGDEDEEEEDAVVKQVRRMKALLAMQARSFRCVPFIVPSSVLKQSQDCDIISFLFCAGHGGVAPDVIGVHADGAHWRDGQRKRVVCSCCAGCSRCGRSRQRRRPSHQSSK